MDVVVEPPEGSDYVKTAHRIGTLGNYSLAWVQPPHTFDRSPHSIEDKEVASLPLVATEVTSSGGQPQPLLGVVYADSPLGGPGRSGRVLSTVSVAVSGIVTLVHDYFKDKKHCSCGSMVFAKPMDSAEPGPPQIMVAAEKPEPAEQWRRVGMLLEVGGCGDARILLQVGID